MCRSFCLNLYWCICLPQSLVACSTITNEHLLVDKCVNMWHESFSEFSRENVTSSDQQFTTGRCKLWWAVAQQLNDAARYLLFVVTEGLGKAS
jgi:hypothetical protein